MVAPNVYLSDEFLEAYAQLPRKQQKKVREFTEKFKADPKSAAINYEKINGVKDRKVRTVRIDQKYRAVVLHPETGNAYVLVWVDNHDEAMAWAANKTWEINPVTGALQVYNVEEVEQIVRPERERPRRPKKPKLLDGQDDETLLSFGVPAILLPSIRAIETEEELQSIAGHLPAEAAEALIWLAEGIPAEEVRAAVAVKPQPKKAQLQRAEGDFSAALEHPDARRRFVTITSGEELRAILDAPLEKWRVFLHPSQEQLVTKSFSGPARVLGGPGTGKTVVAMHRARHLAKTLCTAPGDRVLFTTFTANLAQSVDHNLGSLCGEEKEQIEVVNLHAWAVQFMKDKVQFDIADGRELDEIWHSAVQGSGETEFDVGFLKQEWEHVVQANDLESLGEYARVPRTGRGRTLTRTQRKRVWGIFERFRAALRARGKCDWSSVIRQTRRFIETRYIETQQPELPYKTVIVDEAQDFGAEDWKLIGAIAPERPNNLFIVGDAHQRIYGPRLTLQSCGIGIRGRSSYLRINYRTTEQIRAWAMAVLEGVEIDDLDGQADGQASYRSLLSGPAPDVHKFSTAENEQTFLAEKLRELLQHRRPEHLCLAARTTKMLTENYGTLLGELGIPHVVLGKKHEDGEGVRLATMHRVKGLEFPVMILAGVNAETLPLRVSLSQSDATAWSEHVERERALLFVAATRARDRLVVTSYGEPSPFLKFMVET